MSGLMALVAVFLVFVASKYLKIELPNVGRQQSNLSFELDNDWDNDGLTNREESYWDADPNNPDTDGDGYLDGEEVASGHDPLIPSPDDVLSTDDNLTMKMSQLALAGLVEGSLKSGSPNYERSLNDLTTIIAEDAFNSFEVDLSKIDLKVVSSDKFSQQKYVEELSPVFEELFMAFIEQMSELENNLNNIGAFGMAHGGVSKSFKGASSRYDKMFDDLVKTSVPTVWRSNHLGILKLVWELSQASKSVVSGANDPIKATVGLNRIVQLWDVFPEVTEAYSKKIKLLGLSPETTIFQ